LNLQQLRYLCAIVDHGLNVSAAAESLFTSQPGISKQVRQLEDELGVPIFIRQGKRLTTLTAGGEAIVASARRALQEINNLRRIGAQFKSEDEGTLAIALTHLQARYVLPPVIKRFTERYPKVRVLLHQGDPAQVGKQTASGEADLGIATEALTDFPELVTLPCYSWNRCVLVPNGHPLAKVDPLTLEALVRYPIVTYHATFTGRAKIDAAFDAKGLEPNVVLTALDSDVIKTYVELGLGVGIVSMLAYDAARDSQFTKIDASHLFAPSTARLGLRRGVFLRGYVYDFITMFAPQFDQSAVEAALRGEAESYEL
jgi:LysR family cys regulon transcriptional activator